MDIAAIQSTITGLKVVTGLIKGMQTKNAIGFQEKIIELQAALLEVHTNAISATTAQFELLEQVRALEEQLKAFNDWDEQGPRYALVCPWRDAAQVYALRKASSAGEVPHFVCPNCFLKRQRVILSQAFATPNRYAFLACPSCKASIYADFRHMAAPKYAEEYERGPGSATETTTYRDCD